LRVAKVAPYQGDPNILVHSGFYYAYGNLSDQVRSGVSALKNKYPSAKIAITGHSLGAALSIFCALDLIELYPSQQIVINNFGEPRCGNQAFADYYRGFSNLITWRVVHNKDMIPGQPVQGLGYYHEPTEIWEKTNSAGDEYYTVCSSSNGEDPKCSDSVIQDSIQDHLTYAGLYESCD